MRHTVFIKSAMKGVLMINGWFCGPLEAEGQAYPIGANGEAYIQLFPIAADKPVLTCALQLRRGAIERLEPAENAYAVLWPDGVIELELRPVGTEDTQIPDEQMQAGVLLRYLLLRQAGDESCRALLLSPQVRVDLPPHDGVVPLRFAPQDMPPRFDERAGLVQRTGGNTARIVPVAAATVQAGQGMRRIEQVQVMAASVP